MSFFHKVLCCFCMLDSYEDRHVWVPETCYYFLKFVILQCKANLIQLSLFYFCEDFGVFCFTWPMRLMDDS